MPSLLHSLLREQAKRYPEKPALEYRGKEISYRGLDAACKRFAGGCTRAGLARGARVGIYLPPCTQAVTAFFGTSYCGACLVPVNPVLKSRQVGHILNDCGVELLVTSSHRLRSLQETLERCEHIRHIVLTDPDPEQPAHPYPALAVESWEAFCAQPVPPDSGLSASDLAAIFYTSGSTGEPKGVMFSHRNLCMGAQSVATYLKNTPQDRILSVLPFSFDYGFSQLTTAFSAGATVVLLDYLLPIDIIKALGKYRITGLAGVPSLWQQVCRLEWPENACRQLRYITSSGDTLPEMTVRLLAQKLPSTNIYLMYGLTEAFRSTYLPPDEVLRRPTSIGKAIPHAQVLVVRPDGSPCPPGEAGELVHRGPLVAQGYWNQPLETARRFRPLGTGPKNSGITDEIAVWSGDLVTQDQNGYLYFVGRKDEMIKTSGYRVSPAEIEGPANELDAVKEAVAFAVPHPERGQAILLVYTTDQDPEATENELEQHLASILPRYMLPAKYIQVNALPRNSHGKFDRKDLSVRYQSALT